MGCWPSSSSSPGWRSSASSRSASSPDRRARRCRCSPPSAGWSSRRWSRSRSSVGRRGRWRCVGDPGRDRHRVRARRARACRHGAALRRARPAPRDRGDRRPVGDHADRDPVHRGSRARSGSPAGSLAGVLFWLAFRLRLDRAWLLWVFAVVGVDLRARQRRPRHGRRHPAGPADPRAAAGRRAARAERAPGAPPAPLLGRRRRARLRAGRDWHPAGRRRRRAR